MSKILITVKNVHEFMEKSNKSFLMKQDMILTPSAKDFLRNKNYTIYFESDIDITMEIKIRMILKQEFRIADTVQTDNIVELVLKKIKKQ